MYDQYLNKRTYILIAIFVIVIIVLLIPINMPFSITATGKVMAGQEWSLSRQTDGSILSTISDYAQDQIKSYTAYQVDRGDVFHFKLKPEFNKSAAVASGDTIGFIYSNMYYQQIDQLEGALAVAKANMEIVSSGEQESILAEARENVRLARERMEVQMDIQDRQSALYKQSLISPEEFEITRGRARISEMEVAVAEAQLVTAQIGEKPEIIKQAEIQILAIEKELVTLRKRLSDYTLTAPINGNVQRVLSPDTLLLVTDDTRIVLIPISWQFLNDVDTNLTFSIETKYNSSVLEGSIARKSDYMRLISGQQVFIVTGILNDTIDKLPINMLVQCSVHGMRRTVWDYVSYFLKALI
jgi:hypothetical protein